MRSLAGHTDIDNVRDATDLVRLIGEHVALRPKGREHVGLCPFHDDKNPSFCVVTHKGNAFYKCHACGAGGDAFDFVMNYHRMEFGEALRFLADRAGITLQPRTREHHATQSTSDGGSTRTELRKANAFAARFFQRTLEDAAAGQSARDVISSRSISPEMVRTFMIGAAPAQWDSLSNLIARKGLPQQLFVNAGLLKTRKESEGCYDAFRNRLIFPICDEIGQPIAFGARKINPEDEPKYLNSAESALFSKSKTLYGLHLAKRAIIDASQAIVTEGYTDVIACHQAGICNVVGTLGTALTREHAKVLSRLCDTVVLVFDGDEAGQKAADRGLEVFFSEPVDIKICVLPDQLDPDELLKQPNGRERFQQALAESVDALSFKLNRFRAQLDGASSLSGRQKLLEGFLAELANLGFASLQGVRKRLIMVQLADMFGIDVIDLEAALPKSRQPATPSSIQFTEPAVLMEPERVTISSARRRAEHDLLAVLIYQPELHTHVLQLGDDRDGCFVELFDVEDFHDASAREIAMQMLSFFQQKQTFTVQQLLTGLTTPHARSLAPSLYFSGQRLSEQGNADPLQVLSAAAHSLHAHMNYHQYQETVSQYRQCRDAPDQALLAAQTVIEQRRRQGHIASAISRGVRS